MSVFVNRSLNLRHIQMVGFDMDHTLVRYKARAFEELTYHHACRLLVRRGYPEDLLELPFEYERALVGLVIDKRRGNLLKLSRYGKIKLAFHGHRPLDVRTLRETYQNVVVDLGDPEFQPLDTLFAISAGVLFTNLVELREAGKITRDWASLAQDALGAVDAVHRDGSVKSEVRSQPERFLTDDPLVAALLERYKENGKRLMIITNSDWNYTRTMLGLAIDPHLRKHRSWMDLFDVVITLADKPRFFEQPARFLRVDPDTGWLANHEGPVNRGFFQGGWFRPLQQDLGLDGREILYIGDHIYGDVVSIKKRCDWRTALVLEDLEGEIANLRRARPLQQEIDRLMQEKERVERQINRLDLQRCDGERIDRKTLDRLYLEVDRLNQRISDLLVEYRSHFNPYWGEILRSGNEESRFAGQIDEYACVYMTRVSDLYQYSPRTYFRPKRRLMPHEMLEVD